MTSSSSKSSFGQTLQFITDIKLQELENQRLAYQEHAKVLERAQVLGDDGHILQKVELLAKAVKSWTGSGGLDSEKIVGGKLQLNNLDFWLLQAKNDPSFSLDIAEGWAQTLEEHIRHTVMRFDSAKLFGNLFNEWLASGDSVALAYQAGPDDAGADSDGTGSEFVEVGRTEMYDQKEKLLSIIFDDYSVNVSELKTYLEDLFSSEEAIKALERLRKELKDFGYSLQRETLDEDDVKNAINGLLASGLMDEEKRTTVTSFLENPIVLKEVASVLKMRMIAIESWSWPKDGILVEFRRHLNGRYRAFTDPEIIDALLLHHIGTSWQVQLKKSLTRLFDSKAWIRPAPVTPDTRRDRLNQLRDQGQTSIQVEREKNQRAMFFLTQLQDERGHFNPYDDVVDAPPTSSNSAGPAVVKQKLLHILSTECYLNKALYGSHATVCSDLEWFGPSLPHTSILVVLEFMGMSKTWVAFIKAFLSTNIRFPGDTEPRVRKRGTPISYALSVFCGEAVVFIMDFAVNQRADGLFLHRMHDDLWLWDANAKKVADGWSEMKKYAQLVGLSFNQKKTGSAHFGSKAEDAARLPEGHVRWGFLKFDVQESRFVFDQHDVDYHLEEMRRQLASTKSVFGWVNAYNKFMAFFLRNLGGIPANCLGSAHVVGMVDTLARIQRNLFSSDGTGPGSAVGYLKQIIKERFGVTDLPEGYFYFPISSGGLELRNTMLELLVLERNGKPLVTWGNSKNDLSSDPDGDENDSPSADLDESFVEYKATAEDKFSKRMGYDVKDYAALKEAWEQTKRFEDFMTLEQYTSLRESWLPTWGKSYRHMLAAPDVRAIVPVPKVTETLALNTSQSWYGMDWYSKWVVSMYGEEVVKKFGGLEAVDPSLIPVGMVQLFRTSRIKLDQ